VVLVVATLAMASCFPLFSERENARRASCLNNCKQVMLALKQYSQDFMELYPWHLGVKNPELAWRDLGILFPNYNSGSRSFFCPSAKDEPFVLKTEEDWKKNPLLPLKAADNSKVISYAYGINGSGKPTRPWDENARSTVRMLADKKAGIELKGDDARLANHHNNGRNVAYHDGHVKWAVGGDALDPDPDDEDIGAPDAPDYKQFWSDPPWYREGMNEEKADAPADE
jgi:prepilin-type processing-associated H-X9-DG protein